MINGKYEYLVSCRRWWTFKSLHVPLKNYNKSSWTRNSKEQIAKMTWNSSNTLARYLSILTTRLRQKLFITPLPPSAPALPPDKHRHAHRHGENHTNTIKCKGPAIVRGVNEMLYGERDGKVDNRRAYGKYDHQFTRNLDTWLVGEDRTGSVKYCASNIPCRNIP